MKKSLFVFGMAISALTGCTQSEVLDVADSRAIGFDAFVGKPTRTDVTNDGTCSDMYHIVPFVLARTRGFDMAALFR